MQPDILQIKNYIHILYCNHFHIFTTLIHIYFFYLTIKILISYNTIGSLTSIKKVLSENNIQDFKSVKELIDFLKYYEDIRIEIIKHFEKKIKEEYENLKLEILELENSLVNLRQATEDDLNKEIELLENQLKNLSINKSTNFFGNLKNQIQIKFLERKLKLKKENFATEVKNCLEPIVLKKDGKKSRFNFIEGYFDTAVNQIAVNELNSIDKKHKIISENTSFLYGAIGEQKVAKELSILSDEYYLINDFCMDFNPPIYNKKENDHIFSIQVDHILIGPSGVYIIETKNWSKKSLENNNLRSPVDQIKRTSFVLYLLLNKEEGILNAHHWGKTKIPIKNLIVLINNKPKEDFQFVKILNLNELVSYVKYFPAQFTKEETEAITKHLLRLNNN